METPSKLKEALLNEQDDIAKTLNISLEELDILNQNLEYIGKYVHLSQHDVKNKYTIEDLQMATSQVLLFLFICEHYDIPPASLIIKIVKDTLKYKAELARAANNG